MGGDVSEGLKQQLDGSRDEGFGGINAWDGADFPYDDIRHHRQILSFNIGY